ncbi:MAG: M20/M25/M40 family metallo-hydrolase [Desulfurococcales archaeon]|nr:M20/M25/M40 family metallo-hydrolase [Desulfurococcales archaeon]
MAHRELVDLLASLVSIDTSNDPLKGRFVGEGEGRAVFNELRRVGFEGRLLLESGVPIILGIRGSGRPISLFMAHFDVVPPGPGWSRDPFTLHVEGDRAYGRGSADDKSNVASITLAYLSASISRGTLIVAFTGDEEIGGSRGAGFLAGYLKERNLWPDQVINGDGFLSSVITRRRNAFTARIMVEKSPGEYEGCTASREFHARTLNKETMHSAYFVPGVDVHPLIAASEWARTTRIAISALSGEWVKSNVIPRKASVKGIIPGNCSQKGPVDWGLTSLVRALLPLSRAPVPVSLYSDFGVTINPNVYYAENRWHVVELDIRAMESDKENIENSLGKVVEENLSGYKYELEVRGGKGYLYTSRGARIVELALAVNKRLGLNPDPVEGAGASDSRYFSTRGVESIDYGPLGGNVHGADEYVYLSHLGLSMEFYRRLMEELHQK